jgi:hypothetical protein
MLRFQDILSHSLGWYLYSSGTSNTLFYCSLDLSFKMQEFLVMMLKSHIEKIVVGGVNR